MTARAALIIALVVALHCFSIVGAASDMACAAPVDALSAVSADPAAVQVQQLRALFASTWGVPTLDAVQAALGGAGVLPQLLESSGPLTSIELFRLLGAVWTRATDRALLASHVEQAFRSADLLGDETHFRIEVEAESGRKLALRVAATDTVLSLKERIAEAWAGSDAAFAVAKQTLVHAEHGPDALLDTSPLSEYAIVAGSMISLLLPNLLATIKYQGAVSLAGASPMSWPEGVAYDRTRSRILVADYGLHRVVALTRPRFELAWQHGTGVAGDDDLHLNYPTAVALHGDHTVYIADSFNARLVQLRADTGAFVAAIGARGDAVNSLQFATPMGVAVFEEQALACIADADNHRVQCLALVDDARTGASAWGLRILLGATGQPGRDKARLNAPRSVAAWRDLLFVADKFNHRVQVFNVSSSHAAGAFVRTLGTGNEGVGDGELSYPHAVHVSSNGVVYVSEPSTHRVSLWRASDGAFIGLFAGTRDSTKDPNQMLVNVAGVYHDVHTNTVFIADDRYTGKFGRVTVWKLKKSELTAVY